jgi:hypothetical protein
MPLRPIRAIMRHRVRPAAERAYRSLYQPTRSTVIKTAHRQQSLPMVFDPSSAAHVDSPVDNWKV